MTKNYFFWSFEFDLTGMEIWGILVPRQHAFGLTPWTKLSAREMSLKWVFVSAGIENYSPLRQANEISVFI